jgi:glycosyltransferase involved in cell wall biosynthesis
MKKYSVLVDLEKLRNPYGGMGQVCLHFGRELAQSQINSDLQIEVFAPKSYQAELSAHHLKFIAHRGIYKWLPVGLKSHNLWHSMCHDTRYMPKSTKTKVIQTIHDLNFLFDDRRHNPTPSLNAMQKAVDRASHIVTISQFTKSLLLDHIKVDPSKVSVTYWGSTMQNYPNCPTPSIMLDNRSEFLFGLGHFFWKKNFHPLLHLLPSRPELKLVIAGEHNTEYGLQVKELAQQLKIEKQLLLIGKISDPEKYWYMKNAKAIMVPSLQEGFGLPVVEAMTLKKPVFCSKEMSLPEIGGSYAFYFDEFTPDSINSTYDRYINSQINMDDANRFSWKRCVEEYTHLYKSCLSL